MNDRRLIQGAAAAFVWLAATTQVLSAPLPDSNIFTPPQGAAEDVPSYCESNAPGDRLRKALLGDRKDNIPTLEQLRTIPSLTPPERKQLHEIFTNAKQQLEPIKQQLNQLKESHQGNVKEAMADPQTRERFMDLRRQIRDLRAQTWQQVKTVLSDNQLQELEAMRHGELRPATFNPPMTNGPGGKPQPLAGDEMMAPPQQQSMPANDQ